MAGITLFTLFHISIELRQKNGEPKRQKKKCNSEVFSASGGMGHEASVFYKRLASLLSDKWNDPCVVYGSSVVVL